MWSQIFALGAPLAEKVLRPIVVYAFLVVVLRVFGKRELAQLNPFDLVVLLSLSNTVQNAIIGNDNSLTGGLVGAFTLLAVNYLVVRFLFRHRRLDQMFEGKPTVLIDEGKIVKRALAKELLTRAELMTVLHRQGFASLEGRGAVRPGAGRDVLCQGKTPPADQVQHAEVMKRLEELSAQTRTAARNKGAGPTL